MSGPPRKRLRVKAHTEAPPPHGNLDSTSTHSADEGQLPQSNGSIDESVGTALDTPPRIDEDFLW